MKFQMTNNQLVKETEKIIKFIKSVLKKQNFEKVVIPVSGGIDSSTSLLLLTKAIDPKNIITVKLPYGKQDMGLADLIIQKAGIPKKNIININIKPTVDQLWSSLEEKSSALKKTASYNLRFGNIMMRVRMAIVYDLTKKYQALAIGAENKSEYLLGYYTRHGDEACDLAVIRHLYKTQVFQLAKYLGVPKKIINTPPSAGLWKNQTDEKELGFTYKEADQVLYLYFEKKLSLEKIEKKGFKNSKKIVRWVKKNKFKQKVPYHIVNIQS